MENTDYSIKYLKTCACGCGTKFNGRLNQKYFNTSHKAKANNLKAAKRRKELSSIFARMEVNYFIFLEMKENDKLGVWFDISEVIRKGFDPNIPTNQLKNSKDKREESGSVALIIFRRFFIKFLECLKS
jgi:hypothetical protein